MAERRRNLRALPGVSKPNTIAKTECSATSFAILRQKAKRGCGRTSASKFKPPRRAKTEAEIIKFQGKSVEEPEVWCCASKHQYSGDRALGVCLIKFYKIWRNGHDGPFLDAKRA